MGGDEVVVVISERGQAAGCALRKLNRLLHSIIDMNQLTNRGYNKSDGWVKTKVNNNNNIKQARYAVA
jgi:hypothetical protein